MYDRAPFPDDVPAADAAEQQRAVSEPALEEEAAAESSAEWPLEAAAPDWQDQLEAVDYDPDESRTDA
jgi:hypothetical protein